MRPTFTSTWSHQVKFRAVLLSMAAAAAVGLAFFVGFENGKRKMDDFCGLVIRGSSAGAHAEVFSKHVAAIKAIENGNTAEAERLLHVLARVDAQAITQCKNDPNCENLSMTAAPDQALLQKALASK